MRYMLWNNKGGVGKTFLTYLLASEYAKKNEDVDVVVADLCPQANVSEMMLGGNGMGEMNLANCYKNRITIASYIQARYDKSRFGKIGSELSYFVKVSDYNKSMPENIFLLPGDTDLDICSAIINYLALAPERGAWLKSRRLLLDVVESFEADRARNKRKVVFFFDCNPSFANYTEMAAIASDRLIIPFTADSASMRGIYNVFRMIYGVKITTNDDKDFDDAVFDTFVSQVKAANLILPKIHLFIHNKSRSSDKKAAKAFAAHIDETNKIVTSAKVQFSDLFSDNVDFVINVKDGNTLASVANYSGIPLSDMLCKKYKIYEQETQVNETQKKALLDAIIQCVALL